jgi:chromate transporter
MMLAAAEHRGRSLSTASWPLPEKHVQELALVFLRLGLTAFGGPAAHIAMMEQEFVRRRSWLTREQFLDLVGAASLIPGPSSTQVAIYVGYRRGGLRGLALAGLGFILPAALMVTAIAFAYVRFGRLPAAGGALLGIKAVIIAILVQALFAFGRTALKSAWLVGLAGAAAVASLLGISPVIVLFSAGVAYAAARTLSGSAARIFVLGPGALATTVATTSPSALKLLLVFLKIGSVVFGSGYVLLAFLRADLVDRTHWLTEAQLVDAVAVGQFTPGPVFTTATFIGYVIAGWPGAAAATVGVFLPSFVLVALSGPLIPRLRSSKTAAAFLDGVNATSVALMAVVAAELALAAIVDVVTLALAVASGVVLFRWKVNSAWLVLAGAAVGAAAQGLR